MAAPLERSKTPTLPAIPLRGKLDRRKQRQIACRMLAYALGEIGRRGGDVGEIASWRRFARRNGGALSVYLGRGGPPGHYLAVSADPRYQGTIFLNLAARPRLRLRALLHETAHHLMHVWVPADRYDAAQVISYDDPDADDVRHQIARLFEDLVMSRLALRDHERRKKRA